MTYQVDWYTEDRVIYLELQSQLVLDELKEINKQIIDLLKNQQNRVNVIINAVGMQSDYYTSNYLRETQRYVDHLKVDTIYFVSANKVNRLIAVLAFGLARAHFIQYKNMEDANRQMKYLGFETKKYVS